MTTIPLDPEDPRALGPYTIRARLGEGGMGVVYLADGPDGPVALKVVRRLLAADDTFRTRFRREVLAARRVSGRGVVELLDADTEGDRPYLAMGYVDGPTLLDEVTTSGPVRGERLRALMVALAEAVDTIHRSGVTHRDLKPGNVLLAEDQPVVVDFGVATATEATSITVVGTVMGSPGWMAPEQVTGGAPSPAMDVFAWGTLVTWAATGRNPFGTGRPEAVAYRIIHDEP
ncbi:MAG: serine/threonine-protein kinase, partial [Acidimicrobiales bacterium]